MSREYVESRGLCTDPEYRILGYDWFSEDPDIQQTCRNICDKCPVKYMCAQEALDRNEIHGIWGGMEDFRVRRALGVDSFGNKRIITKDLHCPFCESPLVNIATKREQGGYEVSCTSCRMEWTTHRDPKKSRKLIRRQNDKYLGHGLGDTRE